MNIKDFKVGQTVYVELTGNASRGKTAEQCIEEWEIVSVGRKYVKANEIGKTWKDATFEQRESDGRFVQKTNYSPDYILYLTRQEIEDKHEKTRLYQEISEVFRGYGESKKLTLEQLRKIKGILEESEENQ